MTHYELNHVDLGARKPVAGPLRWSFGREDEPGALDIGSRQSQMPREWNDLSSGANNLVNMTRRLRCLFMTNIMAMTQQRGVVQLGDCCSSFYEGEESRVLVRSTNSDE